MFALNDALCFVEDPCYPYEVVKFEKGSMPAIAYRGDLKGAIKYRAAQSLADSYELRQVAIVGGIPVDAVAELIGGRQTE